MSGKRKLNEEDNNILSNKKQKFELLNNLPNEITTSSPVKKKNPFVIKRKNGEVISEDILLMRKKELSERLKKITQDKQAKLEDLKYGMQKFLEVPNTRYKLGFLDIRDINTKKEGQRIGIFGQTGSGKSYVAKAIMGANKHIPFWVIMCQSESTNHQYGMHMINDLTIWDYYDEEALISVKNRQIKVCEEWKIPKTEPSQFVHDPSVCVLLDDLAEYEEDMNKSKVLGYYHCVSRHHKVLFIELYQYYSQLKPKFRRQLSWVVVMRPSSDTDIKNMHKEFFGALKFNDFKEVLLAATQSNGCLVLNILSKENIENRMFYYKAPYPSEEFIVGTKWSKKLYQHYYNDEWKNTTEEVNEQIAENAEKERELLEMYDEIKYQEQLLKELEKQKKEAQKSTKKSKIELEQPPIIKQISPPPKKIEKQESNVNQIQKQESVVVEPKKNPFNQSFLQKKVEKDDILGIPVNSPKKNKQKK